MVVFTTLLLVGSILVALLGLLGISYYSYIRLCSLFLLILGLCIYPVPGTDLFHSILQSLLWSSPSFSPILSSADLLLFCSPYSYPLYLSSVPLPGAYWFCMRIHDLLPSHFLLLHSYLSLLGFLLSCLFLIVGLSHHS